MKTDDEEIASRTHHFRSSLFGDLEYREKSREQIKITIDYVFDIKENDVQKKQKRKPTTMKMSENIRSRNLSFQ